MFFPIENFLNVSTSSSVTSVAPVCCLMASSMAVLTAAASPLSLFFNSRPICALAASFSSTFKSSSLSPVSPRISLYLAKRSALFWSAFLVSSLASSAAYSWSCFASDSRLARPSWRSVGTSPVTLAMASFSSASQSDLALPCERHDSMIFFASVSAADFLYFSTAKSSTTSPPNCLESTAARAARLSLAHSTAVLLHAVADF